MRPWLVVVGAVFLTLGAGSAAALYFGDQGAVSSTDGTGPISFPLASNSSQALTLQGDNGTSETFHLAWSSSASLEVILESPAGCAAGGTPCWSATTLATWPANDSGAWSGSGPFHYPLQCVLRNTNPDSATVSVSGKASALTPVRLTWVFTIVLGSSAAALFVVGGLAIFLGLFLAGDPYGPGRPMVSRSAEDVDEIVGEPGPPH